MNKVMNFNVSLHTNINSESVNLQDYANHLLDVLQVDMVRGRLDLANVSVVSMGVEPTKPLPFTQLLGTFKAELHKDQFKNLLTLEFDTVYEELMSVGASDIDYDDSFEDCIHFDTISPEYAEAITNKLHSLLKDV